jgi:hypothetical protein
MELKSLVGRKARVRAERKKAERPVGREADLDAAESPILRCPRCGWTNLAEGDQAFEGKFLMCGNCNWQGVTKAGVWG